MSRIRTIKPDFFRHEGLYEAEVASRLPLRLAFAGLWTVADREGRFKWRPRELKLDCLPYDNIDFCLVLDALQSNGLIVRYGRNGEYGCIPSWKKHQLINQREASSTIPSPQDESASTVQAPALHVRARASTWGREGEREEEGKGRRPEAKASAAGAAMDSPEVDLFRRGKEILGQSSGGLIKNLIKAKKGSIAAARAAIETASTKYDPREFIAGSIRGDPAMADARARGDAW